MHPIEPFLRDDPPVFVDIPPIGSPEWHASIRKLCDEWRSRPRTMAYNIEMPDREIRLEKYTVFLDDRPESSSPFLTDMLEKVTQRWLNDAPFTADQVEAAAAVARAKPCPECMGSKVLRGFTSADRPCPCSPPEPELGPSEWTLVERKDDVAGYDGPETVATFQRRSERLTVRVWRAPGTVPLTVVGTADHGPIGAHCWVIGEFCPDMALARVESGLRRGTITARDTQP